MNKVLLLEKRGCNFFNGDRINELSDVGNYRVCTPNECIKGKDGNLYFLEFTSSNRYRTRYTHKITGKPLKNPIRELVFERALYLDTEYTNERGCWRNCKLEEEFYNKEPMAYTLDNILKVVNWISADTYTSIEFIYNVDK